jgi:hypothetical protein
MCVEENKCQDRANFSGYLFMVHLTALLAAQAV